MTGYDYYTKTSAIADKLKKYEANDFERHPLKEVIQQLDTIESVAHDVEIDFDSARFIVNDERLADALNVIRAVYIAIGRRLETQNARDILAADKPWGVVKSFHYYGRYLTLVGNEVQLAGLSAGDRVASIGGGSVPLTPMLLNKCYGIEGISIERVPQIAERSRHVLGKLGYDSEIKVICGDETALADETFDGVIIGASAEPKRRVFTNVQRLAAWETKILYRTYTGMRSILYPEVTEEDLNGFQEVARVLPTGKVNNTSVLIRKSLDTT